MQKVIRLLLGSVICLLAFTVNAAKIKTIHVDTNSPEFQVKLPANATTGYSWTIKNYDKKKFHLTGSQYKTQDTKLIGAGGEMIFSFELNQGKSYPKNTQMDFTYSQSWDSASGSETKVNIIFNSK